MHHVQYDQRRGKGPDTLRTNRSQEAALQLAVLADALLSEDNGAELIRFDGDWTT